MTTYENIKYYREKQGLSQDALAKKVGYGDRTSISKIESGRVDLSSSKIVAFANALGVSPAKLMGFTPAELGSDLENVLPVPETYKVPVIGTIACGQPIPALEDAKQKAKFPGKGHVDFALICKGDSMINARIFDGDTVFIRAQEEVENGQIAAVRIDDEATLKKVYYNKEDGRLVLRACNPLFPDMVFEGDELNRISILGLAVGFYSIVRHE